MVPRDTDPAVLEALQDRVVPALETLVAAARKRDELETQVIETKALRRSNVVKTAVLRSVSHDLRSPLTAITTAAGGLGSETLSPEARAELTSVIALESARLSRLVDNLLDLSQLQAGRGRAARRLVLGRGARARGHRQRRRRRRAGSTSRSIRICRCCAPTPRSSSERSPTCSTTRAVTRPARR